MELRGFAELPADTFAEGPPSGQYESNGSLRSEPRYQGQPVQGFSGVQFADKSSYWFLSDNGFGSKLNSQDYLLRLYRLDPSFKGAKDADGSVDVIDFVQLSDPDKKVPFSIKNEDTAERLLTGFDLDVESFVIAKDGTFWVGEEFGPYLLHFDKTGKLLNAPIPTPDFATSNSEDIVRSPDNPDVLAGTATENLRRSTGYEGLAINPASTKLYALLEGSVQGDPADTLRINEFDLIAQKFTEIAGKYRLESPDHAIGDITVVNENEYLVIERDKLQGDEAQFKKIFKIDLSQQGDDGYVAKKEVVDLLNINDPSDLNADSSTKFRFPFVTIEDVLVVDENTILVANDNNYPGSGGRSSEPDPNEILLLKLDQPLNLDSRVGIDALSENKLRFGTQQEDVLEAGQKEILFGGEGKDILDATAGKGENRLYGGKGDDILFGGVNDRLFGGEGDDILFAGDRDNTLTGGDGKDQFWLVGGDIPGAANTITDFQSGTDVLGLGAGLAFANLEITQAGSDTAIRLNDGTPLATLTGVEASSLSIADFASTAPRPLIIGHRGASGFRPEHTLASYELAIALGADYIEPDLVSTKDGILIARHENQISGTTDVANHPEFAERETTKTIDGVEVTGWFTEDFTLEEIKTLRAKERIPDIRPGSAEFDGQFEIPTFEEVIELAQQKSAQTGRTIGIYPETKHPTYFDSIGLSLEEPLVATLEDNGYADADDPVFIQSFEVGNLKDLNERTDVPLIQLFDESEAQPYDFVVSDDSRTYGDLLTPTGLAEIATYADGIGPWKRLIIPAEPVDRNGDGQPDDLNGDGTINDGDNILQAPTSLIEDAHAAGLLVHAYTFRNEDFFLSPDYNGNPELEYEQFFGLGLDGLFTDFPGTGFDVASRLYPFTDPDPLMGVGLLASNDTPVV